MHLRTPFPLLTLYWIVTVDVQGRLRLLLDIDGRDAKLLADLDAPPAATLPK